MWRDVPRFFYIGLALIAGVVFVLLSPTMGVGAGMIADQPGDVVVVNQTCDDGHIVAFTAEVSYVGNESETWTPHVWSSKYQIQYSWQPTQIQFRKGKQTVRVKMPTEKAAPLPGQRAQLWFGAGERRLVTNFETIGCEGGQ
jgi:hypothetical protein